MPESPTLTIGALARAVGVSAQTLRHYDRLGILRPSATTRAGYRRYTAADRERLALVRALRGLDFDLPTIATLLRGATDARTAADLHLRALDLQVKTLTRRRAVLRLLLRDAEGPALERLRRLHVLATVDERDRARFVGEALDERLRGTAHASVGALVRRFATVDLPESPTEAQVEAWIELAELVVDASFLARHRSDSPILAAGSHSAAGGNATAVKGRRAYTQQRAPVGDLVALCVPAARAVARGIAVESAAGRRIIARWAAGMLRRHDRPVPRPVRSRARALQGLLDRARDPREERFWELLAVLNPEVAHSPITVAWPWLTAGLRVLAD